MKSRYSLDYAPPTPPLSRGAAGGRENERLSRLEKDLDFTIQ
jgi:hypothetical protein